MVNSINMVNIKGNLRKIGCDSRNKMKVVQIYHLCEKGKFSMQPLIRPTYTSPVRISYSVSEESALE